MAFVVPAVLPVSRKELERRLAFFANIPSVGRVQIDVVDGRLASPASWPYNAKGELRAMLDENKTLPKTDQMEYEIDLMCLDALDAVGDWLALGASRLTFHIETVVNTPHFFETVRARYGGGKEFALAPLLSVGLALNVTTDVRIAEPYLASPVGDGVSNGASVDYVQFMGIAKIGRQGQTFDTRVLAQVRDFRAKHPDIPVQVDGGVTLQQAKELRALGVSNVIVGSAILEAKDPVAAFSAFEVLESMYGV